MASKSPPSPRRVKVKNLTLGANIKIGSKSGVVVSRVTAPGGWTQIRFFGEERYFTVYNEDWAEIIKNEN